MYLNKDAMNPETPLHEYTYLWERRAAWRNPKLWDHDNLLRQISLWSEVVVAMRRLL